jgi:cbb3-type cytochrome oxidase subunit 3
MKNHSSCCSFFFFLFFFLFFFGFWLSILARERQLNFKSAAQHFCVGAFSLVV